MGWKREGRTENGVDRGIGSKMIVITSSAASTSIPGKDKRPFSVAMSHSPTST